MAHLVKDKRKLINRAQRIRGQVDAIARALDEEQDCARILQTIAACRGALDGLMSEVFEGHIRLHILDPVDRPSRQQAKAAAELIRAAKSYLK